MFEWTQNVPIRESDRNILDQNGWLGDLSIQIVAAEKSDCRMTIANLMGKLKGANESLALDCWSMPFHSPKRLRASDERYINRHERKWAIETIYRRLRTNLFHSLFSHHFNGSRDRRRLEIECFKFWLFPTSSIFADMSCVTTYLIIRYLLFIIVFSRKFPS